MNIVEEINKDIVTFMKDNNKKDLTTLRMAKNALQSEKIRVNHELSGDEIIATLKKFVKQKKDNIEEYTSYGKEEIVKDLQREVELVSKYLPEELSKEEINKGLDEIFAKVQPWFLLV